MYSPFDNQRKEWLLEMASWSTLLSLPCWFHTSKSFSSTCEEKVFHYEAMTCKSIVSDNPGHFQAGVKLVLSFSLSPIRRYELVACA